MTKTQEIPADVMAEAKKLLNDIVKPDYVRSDALVFVFRALMARDTAARKECVEIARGCTRTVPIDDDGINCTILPATGHEIATAIEATIGGGDE